jgi:hypothetical protein
MTSMGGGAEIGGMNSDGKSIQLNWYDNTLACSMPSLIYY